MFEAPFYRKIKESKNILLAGMGGGYDVLTGIPLYFELLPTATTLVLSNFTFTKQLHSKCQGVGTWITPDCLEVRYTEYVKAGLENAFDESLGFPTNYFPEFYLSKWFHDNHGRDIAIYAISEESTVAGMTKAYQALAIKYNLDTIVLVDAGVDSLLKHDEQGVGTYGEDLMSIFAARDTPVPHKYLMTVGLGTEGGISEEDFLENWSKVQRMGGWLGSVGWHPEIPSVAEYISAYKSCIPTNTTINAQIVAGIEGRWKHYCPDEIRSRGLDDSSMFITGLMGHCWFWDLPTVIAYKLFLPEVEGATTLSNLQKKMEAARTKAGLLHPSNGAYCGQRRYSNLFK